MDRIMSSVSIEKTSIIEGYMEIKLEVLGFFPQSRPNKPTCDFPQPECLISLVIIVYHFRFGEYSAI